MTDTTPSAAERGLTLVAELDEVIRTYGEDRATWPAGQVVYAERLEAGIRKLTAAADVEVARAQRSAAVRAAIADPASRENGFGSGPMIGSMSNHRDPYSGLSDDVARSDSLTGLVSRANTIIERYDEAVPDEGRNTLVRMLEHDQSLDSAAFVIALSDPNYVSAFTKGLRGQHGYRTWNAAEQLAFSRVEAVRAAMGEGGTGTYLVPIPLDPSIVLTNTGILNPLRAGMARVETTAYATWTGAASAGATATWTAENTAVTESNPALTQLKVTPQKMTAYLTASYELFQDSNLGAQLPLIIQDAFDRLEGDAFINGNGTTQPQGIITAISATAGSTVTATTRGSFTSASIGDIYAMDNALPVRARSRKPLWMGARTTINTIRQMSAAAQGSSFWANLGENTPPQLLDHQLREASAVSASTASGSINLILGDASSYLIVDRIGTQVEWIPNVVDTNGVPTGTRGWVAWKRVGALVENVDAFRFLKC